MRKKDFDLEKMSEQTSISITAIKVGLGITLEGNCKETSFKKAIILYGEALMDSEEEYLALKKAIELTLTIEELNEVCISIPTGSSLEFLALGKRVKLLGKELSVATTFDQIVDIFHKSPKGSMFKNSVLIAMINSAKSLNEKEFACEKTTKGSALYEIALKNLAECFIVPVAQSKKEFTVA